jgi:hypothetical protein
MGQSPLAGAFAQPRSEKKKKRKGGLLLLVGVAALATSVGGVFAANSITINSATSGKIEFGQGIATTNTCDAALTAALNQVYDNTLGGFKVSSVVVSGIDDSLCGGRTIRVSLLGSSGTAVCSIDGTHVESTVTKAAAATTLALTAGSDAFTFAADATANDVAMTITPSSTCDASTVVKVAVTTS